MYQNTTADTKDKRKKETPTKTPALGMGKKSVRTSIHVYHFSNLPFGEITIESNSIVKHCAPHGNKESKKTKSNGERD
jgi:hypothetical protein